MKLNHETKLTDEQTDAIFANAKTQGDYFTELYRAVVPDWENVVSLQGYPVCGKELGTRLVEKAIAFDKIHHPEVLAGGLWMNRGFALRNDIGGNWVSLHECEIEYKTRGV